MRCDIIIPVWNQLSATRDCIDSIKKNTAGDFGLIIIDNASDAETRSYLLSLRGGEGRDVKVIINGDNLGFVKAANQGMAASKAPYVCLLNNDTLVTKGWLTEMIAVAETSEDIGIVNPSSNNLGQRPAPGEPIGLYADQIRRQSGYLVELGAAIGFCMLIKRQVIEKIGVFDEIYGMGNFEDTDFSRKAMRAGYRSVRACGAYVYHRESSSFGRVKTFEDDFKRNREIYEFRWGRPRRVAYILDLEDPDVLQRLKKQSLDMARDGNWVYYFSKDGAGAPEHSNVVSIRYPGSIFYFNTVLKILARKKKFDEIFVGSARLGSILEGLALVHTAKVRYY